MRNAVLFVLLVAAKAFGQEPTLIWDDFHAPAYRMDAQLARIQGPVIIEFTLDTDNVVAIKKSTGHPLLLPAALETIKTSKLHCDNCEPDVTTFTVVFNFAVANHDCEEAERHPPSTVKLDSSSHVSFNAEPLCTKDPVEVRRYRNVRSIQCLYLWRCKKVLEYSSTSAN